MEYQNKKFFESQLFGGSKGVSLNNIRYVFKLYGCKLYIVSLKNITCFTTSKIYVPTMLLLS